MPCALASIRNARYFTNLENYEEAGWIFDRHSGRDKAYRRQWHLYPPNIVCLQIIVDYLEEKGVSACVRVVDLPAGLGNFLGYCTKFLSADKLVGIDNFSQISREHVALYQARAFGLTVTDALPTGGEATFLVCMGLPVEWVRTEIAALRPCFILAETRYLVPFNSVTRLEAGYDVDAHIAGYELKYFNPLVALFERR